MTSAGGVVATRPISADSDAPIRMGALTSPVPFLDRHSIRSRPGTGSSFRTLQAYLVAGLAEVGVGQPKYLDGRCEKAGQRRVVQPVSDNRLDVRSDGQRDRIEVFGGEVPARVATAQLREQGGYPFPTEGVPDGLRRRLSP